MPCERHDHAWPQSGIQEFVIESCERSCGWCNYHTKAANNLRAHARAHISSQEDQRLCGIIIAAGKAGRHSLAKTRQRDTSHAIGLPSDARPSPRISLEFLPSTELLHPEETKCTRTDCIALCKSTMERIAILERILRRNGLDVEAEVKQQSNLGDILFESDISYSELASIDMVATCIPNSSPSIILSKGTHADVAQSTDNTSKDLASETYPLAPEVSQPISASRTKGLHPPLPRDEWYSFNATVSVWDSLISRSRTLQDCPICERPVLNELDLEKHKERHHKPFVCSLPRCYHAEGFRLKSEMLEHIIASHAPGMAGRYWYRGCSRDCRAAEVVWLSATDFADHLRRHHPRLAKNDYTLYAFLRRSENWDGNYIPKSNT